MKPSWLLALVPPLLFVLVAWPALEESSVTYDETYHVPAGYSYLTTGDYRLGSEHPPLVKQLFALPLLSLAPRVGADAQRAFVAALESIESQWVFGDRFLYRDNRPQPLVWRARAVVLTLGASLVLLVFLWARDAFGIAGGLVAATIAALDPNLLAHSTLATTDLGFSLFFFAALLAVRRTLAALTPARLIVAGAGLGAAFASKHSALLLPPILLVFAVLRLFDTRPWPLGGRSRNDVVTSLRGRSAAVVLVLVFWGLASWAGVWAVYGFRYAVGPETRVSLPIAQWTARIRSEHLLAEMLARGEEAPDEGALTHAAAARPPLPVERAIASAARHRLLPEAYLFGLAVATALAQVRSSYLLGGISPIGWTWYFPFALAVKTPIATLGLAVAALALLVARSARTRGDPAEGDRRWEAVFLLVPPVIVLGAAMRSNVDIGYRHILPMLPFLCALAGYVPAELEPHVGRRAVVAVGVVACLLVAGETLAARPYFLTFFNVLVGGPRGGLRLLSDSNLDWGQGLPALRRWMGEQHVERVNLCYFGSADPTAYGVDFVPLAGSHFGEVAALGTIGYPPRPPVLPGYVAISATHLQGTYLPPELRERYAFLRRKTPVAVPGESIYVYWVERWGE